MEISALTALALPKGESLSAEREAEIRDIAQQFEAVFVRQMLDHAGFAEAFGATDEGLSGNFSTFLLEQVADDLVEKGGFGFAEQVYRQLSQLEGITEKGKTL